MYGMVNRAMEDMVVDGWGEAAWERVKARAGVDVEVFVGTQAYPDDVTYGLVGAASEVLALPAVEVLERFGVHWVTRTAADGYGPLMDAGGKTLGEFLANLPNFHSRVSLLFPQLSPPTFHCTEARPGGVKLHYVSGRDGLAPFVVGLLKGLGIRFATPVRIEQTAAKGPGVHDEFLVSWDEAARA